MYSAQGNESPHAWPPAICPNLETRELLSVYYADSLNNPSLTGRRSQESVACKFLTDSLVLGAIMNGEAPTALICLPHCNLKPYSVPVSANLRISFAHIKLAERERKHVASQLDNLISI
ncbi:hypothetical protein HGRIS_001354 [Hohenbuehelia grisea]|uniref:Uncharacterized protein n=1 Tax=Hohenbuehelia grisea TaxID=104357 RepID=A0ABR3JP23_9AGAR